MQIEEEKSVGCPMPCNLSYLLSLNCTARADAIAHRLRPQVSNKIYAPNENSAPETSKSSRIEAAECRSNSLDDAQLHSFCKNAEFEYFQPLHVVTSEPTLNETLPSRFNVLVDNQEQDSDVYYDFDLVTPPNDYANTERTRLSTRDVLLEENEKQEKPESGCVTSVTSPTLISDMGVLPNSAPLGEYHTEENSKTSDVDLDTVRQLLVTSKLKSSCSLEDLGKPISVLGKLTPDFMGVVKGTTQLRSSSLSGEESSASSGLLSSESGGSDVKPEREFDTIDEYIESKPSYDLPPPSSYQILSNQEGSFESSDMSTSPRKYRLYRRKHKKKPQFKSLNIIASSESRESSHEEQDFKFPESYLSDNSCREVLNEECNSYDEEITALLSDHSNKENIKLKTTRNQSFNTCRDTNITSDKESGSNTDTVSPAKCIDFRTMEFSLKVNLGEENIQDHNVLKASRLGTKGDEFSLNNDKNEYFLRKKENNFENLDAALDYLEDADNIPKNENCKRISKYMYSYNKEQCFEHECSEQVASNYISSNLCSEELCQNFELGSQECEFCDRMPLLSLKYEVTGDECADAVIDDKEHNLIIYNLPHCDSSNEKGISEMPKSKQQTKVKKIKSNVQSQLNSSDTEVSEAINDVKPSPKVLKEKHSNANLCNSKNEQCCVNTNGQCNSVEGYLSHLITDKSLKQCENKNNDNTNVNNSIGQACSNGFKLFGCSENSKQDIDSKLNKKEFENYIENLIKINQTEDAGHENVNQQSDSNILTKNTNIHYKLNESTENELLLKSDISEVTFQEKCTDISENVIEKMVLNPFLFENRSVYHNVNKCDNENEKYKIFDNPSNTNNSPISASNVLLNTNDSMPEVIDINEYLNNGAELRDNSVNTNICCSDLKTSKDNTFNVENISTLNSDSLNNESEKCKDNESKKIRNYNNISDDQGLQYENEDFTYNSDVFTDDNENLPSESVKSNDNSMFEASDADELPPGRFKNVIKFSEKLRRSSKDDEMYCPQTTEVIMVDYNEPPELQTEENDNKIANESQVASELENSLKETVEKVSSEETQKLLEDAELDPDRQLRIKRSSSLKCGKTPPGTPGIAGGKKIVRFADCLGLDLADIRTFLDGVPDVPPSAFCDLQVEEESDSEKSSSLPSYGSYSTAASAAAALLQSHANRILTPMFQQPGALPDFIGRLREQRVILENVSVGVDLSVKGIVRVVNEAFHKKVYIRYTFDHWRNCHETSASYVDGSHDGFSDRFTFLLWGSFLQTNGSLVFCVKYCTNEKEYWDNNRGSNYTLKCYSTEPDSTSNFPSEIRNLYGRPQNDSCAIQNQHNERHPQSTSSNYPSFLDTPTTPSDPWVSRFF